MRTRRAGAFGSWISTMYPSTRALLLETRGNRGRLPPPIASRTNVLLPRRRRRRWPSRSSPRAKVRPASAPSSAPTAMPGTEGSGAPRIHAMSVNATPAIPTITATPTIAARRRRPRRSGLPSDSAYASANSSSTIATDGGSGEEPRLRRRDREALRRSAGRAHLERRFAPDEELRTPEVGRHLFGRGGRRRGLGRRDRDASDLDGRLRACGDATEVSTAPRDRPTTSTRRDPCR